ncbi:glycoside hydrolase family protein [Paenibacillus koleovorans]|uniref:glycoside hydrolase family protein n=1 Tax=Paenibacillus koleovorans TaxID=121608 RepID=UPI000FD86296|nr:glycoside hydrolase family protein [Paenibacillus koleovorans]
MNFQKLLQPVPAHAKFELPGWHVWCGSMTRDEAGRYYLIYSRWPEAVGFESWVTHSELACAVADSPLGPFQHVSQLWDSHTSTDPSGHQVSHNPVIVQHQGRYYLYYMGTHGPDFDMDSPAEETTWWAYRNNQRIHVAVADHPLGPWERQARPLLEVSPGSWDGLVTNNPTACATPDGRFLMMYKGVAEGPPPKGGAVNAGIAIADHPRGPFRKTDKPTISNPTNDWAVEDPCVWWQADHEQFYALIKDFQGYFTGAKRGSIALFQSADGLKWQPAPSPLALDLTLRWADGTSQSMLRLERPQVLLNAAGKPEALICAVLERADSRAYNVQIPLQAAP